MTGIAAEFPGVPHRYCDNHFLRDVAKPVLEADSHAKVQMRKKVRWPAENRTSRAQATECQGVEKPRGRRPQSDGDSRSWGRPICPAPEADSASAVVLDYCAAVRGILNDDQGGPLHPPGLRMAEALKEVRESIQRNLDAKKGGSQRSNSADLADCIDRGLEQVQAEQETIREYVKDIEKVAATLEPGKESGARIARRSSRS